MKTGNRLSPTQPRSTASTLNPTAPPFRPNTSYHSHGKPTNKSLSTYTKFPMSTSNNISSKALTVGHIILIVSDTKQTISRRALINTTWQSYAYQKPGWTVTFPTVKFQSLATGSFAPIGKVGKEGEYVSTSIPPWLQTNYMSNTQEMNANKQRRSSQKSPCTKTSRSRSAVCTGHLIQAGTSGVSYNI